MREVDEEVEYYPVRKKRKLKYPGRFIVFLIAALICIWMIITFAISMLTGQRFSFFGASSHPVRNIVVAGVDEGGYRTDLIMLCQINRRSGCMNVLQIPRDTKVTNRRNDKKINSAYYSGFDCLSGEIQQVTGIKADDYIIVDFKGFNEIIDALGGVKINVPVSMNYTDPVQNLTIDLKAGEQKLDGKHAQMFMRFRKNNDGTGYPNGDVDRIKAQKTLYSAVAKKMLSPIGVLKAPAIFSAVKRNSKTNLSSSELFEVMRDTAAVSGNINFLSLPGGSKYIGGGSYFVCDNEQTQKLVNENFVK